MSVLVVYTDSPEGRAALEQGVALAARESADVEVFDFRGAGISLAEILPDPGAVAARVSAPGERSLDASVDLLDYVEAADVDLIVIGLRQRSRVGKLILGAHAQQILLGANVPVLAVKAQPEHG